VSTNQEIAILIEKMARNLQSTIWILQNAIEDLSRLGVKIAEMNRQLQETNMKEDKKETKGKKQ